MYYDSVHLISHSIFPRYCIRKETASVYIAQSINEHDKNLDKNVTNGV